VPADGLVTVPGLPVRVAIPRAAALGDDGAALRAVVLRTMAETLYIQGPRAFRVSDAAEREPSLLSSQWALEGTLRWLTADRHEALRLPRLVLAVATLLLALLSLLLYEGPAKLLGTGASFVAGAILAGAAALAAVAVTLLIFGGDDVADAIVRRVVRDLALTVGVVAAIAGAFGIILTVLGMVVRRLDRTREDAWRPEPAPEGRPGRRGGG
jgi:hypothetical protein